MFWFAAFDDLACGRFCSLLLFGLKQKRTFADLNHPVSQGQGPIYLTMGVAEGGWWNVSEGTIIKVANSEKAQLKPVRALGSLRYRVTAAVTLPPFYLSVNLTPVLIPSSSSEAVLLPLRDGVCGSFQC